MKRLIVPFAFLVLLGSASSTPEPSDCAVQFVVGRHSSTDVEITVPCIAKGKIADIAASFLANDDTRAEGEMRDHLNSAKTLTLTITSRRTP
jgi:hypothetical protein